MSDNPTTEKTSHHLEANEATRLLECDLQQGLSPKEAAERLDRFGPNMVSSRGGMPAWKHFFLQFHQPLIYILLAAVGITAALAEWVDSGVILGVVIVNAIIGFIQESKAEKAIEAVANCRRAGIQVKMITGDHAITAGVIAKQVGLVSEGTQVDVITGRELENVSNEDLPRIAEETEVFARFAPEQKLRLVQALQARGQVVAMTGDGVNDAPALKQADIGIAMGVTGTDVAKGAADMVLTDDNFASIEAAVEEGRSIFGNLTKFIVWTLPTNLGEGGIIFVSILLGLTLPVLPVQVLWVNMTTALLLGLMLVFEPKEPGLMNRPPRDPKRPLLTFPLFMRTGLVSLIIVGGGLWLFQNQSQLEGNTTAEARTAVINTIVFVETAYLFGCRSLSRSLFAVGLFTNRLLLLGVATMIGLQVLFTYLPVMNRLFHTTPLGADTWLRIIGIALFAFVAVEVEKWIRFGRRRG